MQLPTLENESVISEIPRSHVPTAIWEAIWAPWWPRVARVTVLVLTDLVALAAAVSIGYLLWARFVLGQPLGVYMDLFPLFLLLPLGYFGVGLYPGFGLGAVELLRRLSSCTSFAFLILAAASFVLKLPPQYSRMTFAITWGASLIAVPVCRFLVLSLASRWRWWREPAVLVGSGEWVRSVIRIMENARSLGYRPMGVITPDSNGYDGAVEGIPVLGGLDWAPRVAERGVCVALVRERKQDGLVACWLQQYFRHVVVIGAYGDLPIERVQVRNLGGLIGVEFTNNLLHWRNRLFKRIIDVVLSSLLLLFAVPLVALGGLFVKLFSRGPLFFSQVREGMNGRPIKVRKIRTMYEDAEQRLEACLAANPELRREWEVRCKLTYDPRIIPGVGSVLRRLSVDELPQLWNVITGEMSLVGPRPFPEYHLQQFSPEFRELRRRVRPGLTGIWQVTVRSKGDLKAQERYDTYYIRNWSVWLDLHILGRTAFAVLVGRGAC